MISKWIAPLRREIVGQEGYFPDAKCLQFHCAVSPRICQCRRLIYFPSIPRCWDFRKTETAASVPEVITFLLANPQHCKVRWGAARLRISPRRGRRAREETNITDITSRQIAFFLLRGRPRCHARAGKARFPRTFTLRCDQKFRCGRIGCIHKGNCPRRCLGSYTDVSKSVKDIQLHPVEDAFRVPFFSPQVFLPPFAPLLTSTSLFLPRTLPLAINASVLFIFPATCSQFSYCTRSTSMNGSSFSIKIECLSSDGAASR